MNKKINIKNIFNKIIKFIKDLLDPRSDSSSKRFIAINAKINIEYIITLFRISYPPIINLFNTF